LDQVTAEAAVFGPAGSDGSRQRTTASPFANATSKAPPITTRHVPAAAPYSSRGHHLAGATRVLARW